MTGSLVRSSSRRARRRFGALTVGVIALVAAGCVPLPPPLPPEASQYCLTSPPTSPAHYQQAFDGLRTLWTEWAAADGAYPVDLEDGRVLWLFGDTIVGRVQAYGSIAPGWKFIRNSYVLQHGACFTPLMSGSRGNRFEALPNPAPGEWYWPVDGVVENGTTLRLFLLHMRTDPSQPAGFQFAIKSIDVATYSLPGFGWQGVQSLGLPVTPTYGEMAMLGPDTLDPNDPYLYLYGHQGQFLTSPTEHYLARVPAGHETDAAPPWEFYSSTLGGGLGGWSPVEATATPMLFDPDGAAGPETFADDRGPLAPLNVIPYGTGYLASAKFVDVLSDEVSTWVAPSPEGPWTFQGRAATTGPAEDYGNGRSTFRYGGRVTKLPNGVTIVGWSQNRLPLEDVIANNWWYRTFYAAPAAGSLPP